AFVRLTFQSRSYFLSDLSRWIAAIILSSARTRQAASMRILREPIDRALTVMPGVLPEIARHAGARAVLPAAHHVNDFAGNHDADCVHGWPGRRPGHDEPIIGRVGLRGQISRQIALVRRSCIREQTAHSSDSRALS